MQEHSETFWGIPEVRGLKPDEVVPAHIILDEWQTSEGSNVVTVRKYWTNRDRVIIRLSVYRRFILPYCEDKVGVIVHQTEQVIQLPFIPFDLLHSIS